MAYGHEMLQIPELHELQSFQRVRVSDRSSLRNSDAGNAGTPPHLCMHLRAALLALGTCKAAGLGAAAADAPQGAHMLHICHHPVHALLTAAVHACISPRTLSALAIDLSTLHRRQLRIS